MRPRGLGDKWFIVDNEGAFTLLVAGNGRSGDVDTRDQNGSRWEPDVNLR
jgi:hypothetical protein